MMMLLNAVSFEADWDEKYEEEPLPYLFTAAGNKPQTKMMMFFNEHAYLEDDNGPASSNTTAATNTALRRCCRSRA